MLTPFILSHGLLSSFFFSSIKGFAQALPGVFGSVSGKSIM